MNRLLYSSIEKDDFNAGIIVGLFIGVFYLFGFVYYIQKKCLQILFEDIICMLDGKENEETLRPVIYSILNCLPFLILCFFSTFSSHSDFGIASLIGSDCFNNFFILALIFIKFKDANHGILDTWITFRDALMYILGLISLLLFLVFEWVNLWAAIILITFYLINYSVLVANQEIKEKVMEWLGLNNEDNEFNSDEHFQCRKRRESSTQLKDTGCFDIEEPNLIKKLNRMEALLILKFKSPTNPQKIIYGRFQKAVYQIIFGIRNLAKNEKGKRIEYYEAMYKPRQKRERRESNEQDNEHDPHKKDSNLDQDNDPLIKQDSSAQKDIQPMEDDQDKQDDNQAQSPDPQHPAINNNQDDSFNEGVGVNLKMPKTLTQRILFILFLPVHLILYLLPNYSENPIPKKLVLCLLLNTILLCGCMFMIDWWTYEISRGTGIPFAILGIIMSGIFLSLHFLEYNFRVAREEKQLEFVQFFFQISICKISLCPAIPWIFMVVVQLDLDVPITTSFSFAISIAIYAGLIVIFVILSICSRFRIEPEEGVKMGVLYFLFIIASTVIIAINI